MILEIAVLQAWCAYQQISEEMCNFKMYTYISRNIFTSVLCYFYVLDDSPRLPFLKYGFRDYT